MKQKEEFQYPDNYKWVERNIERRDKKRKIMSFLQVMGLCFLFGFICGTWAVLGVFKVDLF